MLLSGRTIRPTTNSARCRTRCTKLKAHLLADGEKGYLDLESDLAKAKALRDSLDGERRVLDSEVESLKQRMRQHGPAAGVINDMIHGYSGHKELKIAASEDGHHFRRNGKPMEGSLSEGEKTAIALCYFLATVAAEGRKLKDLIVAVDDPISSLDTKALNYAFSIIKGALSDAAQLIMMTHNLHFMNEAKKWLKKKTEKEVGKDKATATLLFLDAVQEAGTETRSSSIRIMPALIREYESEYHYLFHMVLEFRRVLFRSSRHGRAHGRRRAGGSPRHRCRARVAKCACTAGRKRSSVSRSGDGSRARRTARRWRTLGPLSLARRRRFVWRANRPAGSHSALAGHAARLRLGAGHRLAAGLEAGAARADVGESAGPPSRGVRDAARLVARRRTAGRPPRAGRLRLGADLDPGALGSHARSP